jgi:hypothetical protein
MAELSKETQAIIDTLKAEGEISREKGKFSNKSVVQELEKFGSIFDSISSSLQEQNETMKATLGVQIKSQKEESKRRELAETAAQKKDVREKKQVETTTKVKPPKGDSVLGLIGNTLGGLKGLAIKGVGGVVGATFLYQFAKGFIDERYGDGTTAGFVDEVGEVMVGLKGSMADFPKTVEAAKASAAKATELVDNVASVFEGVDFESMNTAMKNFSTKIGPASEKIIDFFENPLTYILPTLAFGAISGATTRTTGQALGGLMGPRVGLQPGGKINATTNLKAAVIGAVAIGVAIYGNKLKEWVNTQPWGDKEVFEDYKVSDAIGAGIDIGGLALQGATIGMMFGPKGALVGAVLGATVGIGIEVAKWWKGKQAENEKKMAQELAIAEDLMKDNEFSRQVTSVQRQLIDAAGNPFRQQDILRSSQAGDYYQSLSPEQRSAFDTALAELGLLDPENPRQRRRTELEERINRLTTIRDDSSSTSRTQKDAAQQILEMERELRGLMPDGEVNFRYGDRTSIDRQGMQRLSESLERVLEEHKKQQQLEVIEELLDLQKSLDQRKMERNLAPKILDYLQKSSAAGGGVNFAPVINATNGGTQLSSVNYASFGRNHGDAGSRLPGAVFTV